jgi:hypothetical protein
MAEPETIVIPTEDLGPEYARVVDRQRRQETLAALRANAAALAEPPPQPPPVPEPAPKDVAEVATAEAPDEEGGITDLLPTPAEAARGLVGGFAESFEGAMNGFLEEFVDNVAVLNDLDSAVAKRLEGTRFEQPSTFAEITRKAAPEFLSEFQENEEKTLIGNVVRDVSNFATAMIPISRVIRGLKFVQFIAKKSPKAASITSNTIAGALAEFVVIDTQNDDLKLLLDDHPSLKATVTEYMNGHDADMALTQRTRAALIGAGLGATADVFFVSIKALRSAIRTKVKLQRLEKAAAKQEGGLKKPLTEAQIAAQGPKTTLDEASVSGLGSDAPLVGRVSSQKAAEKIAKASDELEARFPDMDPEELQARASEIGSDVEINFDRIDTTEDVEQLMQDATDLFGESVEKARRGKISNIETQEAAERLDIGIKEVLSRNVGAPLTAAQTTAYRRVWVSAAETVEGLARVARESGSDLDHFKFRKGLAVFNAVNQSVLGARAEAGRTLQAWRINVAGDAERAAVIGALVDNSGRARVSKKLADNFLNAIDAGHSPGQINKMAERSVFAKTLDAVKESAILGLLWTPATHIANITSNSIRIGTGIAEKGVGGFIGREIMTENGVAAGEATAQLRGTIGAINAIFTRSADAEALSQATAASVAATGVKTDVRINAISAEAFGLDSTQGLGKAVEAAGNVVTAPARLLEKADDFFKMVAYAGEVEAQAFRMATREGIEKGWTPERTGLRMAELMQNPPENIRLEAGNAALYSTFTQQAGSYAETVFKVRDTLPGGFFVLPFVKTPMNVLRYDFEFSPLAPFVGQWRKDVLVTGGARRDVALARMALGTTVAAVMADWAWEDRIQGPLSSKIGVKEAQLRQGLQPDSIRIGDLTVALTRLDPFGMSASMMGGITEVLKTHQIEEEDFPEFSELFAAVSASLAASVLDKTFFTGISRLVSAAQNPDRRGARFVQQSLQMLNPLSSAQRTANILIDPQRRDVADIGDSIMQSIVGLEQRLPLARNLWGEVIVRDRLDRVTPARLRVVDPEPIDAEIVANQIDLQRIARRTSFRGVDINFREFKNVYEAYVELLGNKAKLDGKGLKDTLNALVKTRDYQTWSTGPDGRRAQEIKARRRVFKDLAQHKIMEDPDREFQTEEFETFREYVNQKMLDKQELMVPGIGVQQ